MDPVLNLIGPLRGCQFASRWQRLHTGASSLSVHSHGNWLHGAIEGVSSAALLGVFAGGRHRSSRECLCPEAYAGHQASGVSPRLFLLLPLAEATKRTSRQSKQTGNSGSGVSASAKWRIAGGGRSGESCIHSARA